MKIVQWEYKCIDYPASTNATKVVAELNAMGQDGWELVLCRDRVVPAMNHQVNRLVFLFKRPCGQRDIRTIIGT